MRCVSHSFSISHPSLPAVQKQAAAAAQPTAGPLVAGTRYYISNLSSTVPLQPLVLEYPAIGNTLGILPPGAEFPPVRNGYRALRFCSRLPTPVSNTGRGLPGNTSAFSQAVRPGSRCDGLHSGSSRMCPVSEGTTLSRWRCVRRSRSGAG